MLDAAEALLAEGGPDALTINAVVERSGVSNGSLYARFGDRRGMLAAVQDRFLDRLQLGMGAALQRVEQQRELDAVIRMLVEMFYDTFAGNRGTFNAFMMQTLPLTEFRERGRQATQLAAAAVVDVIQARSEQVQHPDPTRAADFVFRTLFALGTQLAMFDDDETTGTALGRDNWIDETSRMILSFLAGPRSS
jgi:AcrR family transcriptional regulator